MPPTQPTHSDDAPPDTVLPRADGIALPIDIDRDVPTPLPDQLVAEIRRLIAAGAVRPGEPVPASRRLAAYLDVSRGTVETAYAQLVVEGFLTTAERSATRVNPELPNTARTRNPRLRPPQVPRRRLRSFVDLRPGFGGDNPLQEPAFRRAWRDSLDIDPGPIDPLGQPQTRWAIADHLRLTRGMSVDPDDIILTSGSRDGLRLLITTGVEGAIGVENPGFPGLRQAMSDRDLKPIDTTQLPEGTAGYLGAVVVTPNHQFPHGTTMPIDRRVRLLEWAQATGVIVIEDDYDSEARYARTVVPTLYDLAVSTDAPAQVVHIGTFSTLLTSAVSTGYIIAHGELGRRLSIMRTALGPAFSPVMQTAIASYLSSGGLRRRISRGRRRLRAAEAVLAQVGSIPGLVHEGRTLVIETGEATAAQLRTDLAERGILVASLAAGWSADSDVRHGIVIAHSNVEAAVLHQALETAQSLLGEADER
ncbi:MULTISPECIES: MocR-like pyridoxine biosynthesis transcription factor PdxR [Brevibacterium]|uniref:GntR family transcriptional regulator n=1 Tax=Brevibacterium aurantiacum TaxID=273384 RepID=A0A2A3ZME1_BREAU|nr:MULTISPECIES: PLP-dependent aminotransferase family protein [Brevibacterium]MCF2588428.1 PLP-dependent aminotransferase family protein [Brevibacterium sp. UCMA 11752]PCC52840.1 GntR family transcriptional regulator [Brevibacterium aurantiacum]SMX86015.1 transcriptional regulator, GntR family [Brevibacterium aurantiacum]